MKQCYWLVFVVPFLLTCKKVEEESIPFRASGYLLEAETNKPFPNRTMNATDGYWGVGETVYDQVITDENGFFEFNFSTKYSQLNEVVVECAGFPGNHQRYGRDQDGNFVELSRDFDLEDAKMENNQEYIFYCFPKASFYFSLPPLTQELMGYTLEIYQESSKADYFTYSLGDPASVSYLTSVRPLEAANRAFGTFTLRNGVVIKSDTFNVYCPPNLTTEVYLDL